MTKNVTVTQVDYVKGMLKVALPERDSVESNWISIPSFEYDMPCAGDTVMVSFDENDYSSGVCHGKYFSAGNAPAHSGPTTYYTTMCGDVVIKYDSASKVLEITAAEIRITGNVQITGNLTVQGSISATGTILGNPIKGCPLCG